MNKHKKAKKIDCLAKSLKVAGEENRIKILCTLIEQKKICVSDMAKELNASVAITSHHFQELYRAGLVESKREGKNICYYLQDSPLVTDLKRFICKYK